MELIAKDAEVRDTAVMSGEYVQKMNADEGYAGDLDALRYVKCMVVKL